MVEVLNSSARARETGRAQVALPGRAHRDGYFWLVGAVALVLGALFVVVDLNYNQGKLIAPLDDVYIHLQYGRQIGIGQFFHFQSGDPVSSGASSVLYALILGAAYAIGIHGSAFLAFAMAFGVLCFAFSAALTYRLGAVLVARSVGLWAGFLLATSGELLWGSASGMEVGLATLLVVSTLLVLVREAPSGRFRFTPLLGILLALVRPEGLIFAIVLMLASWWTLWTHRRGTGFVRSVLRWAWTLLPLLAGIAQLLYYQAATGTISANGIQAKSLLNDRPVFYLGDFADRAVANLRTVGDIFLGLNNQDYTFPGGLLFCCIGVVYLVFVRRAWRTVFTAMAVGLAAVTLSVATLNTALTHYLRYNQPFLPVFLLFAVAGIYGLTRVVPHNARRFALHGALAIAMVFSLVALPTWAIRFGRDSSTIRDSDVSVALWLTTNVPARSSVAVKDVGAVAYFSAHHVVDLIGLGTNGFAEASNNGVGSVYEKLRHLPAAQRPAYVVGYDTVPGTSLEQMRQVGFLGDEPVQKFKAQTPPDVYGNLIIPFRELDVYKADWTLAGSGDEQVVPGQLRDYLNVGDLDNEAAHSYEPKMEQVGLQPFSVLTRVGETVDSGRNILGGEQFTARNLVPGKDLTITARTDMDKVVPDMQVLVDGKPAGTWVRTPVKNAAWGTYTYKIPGDLITKSTADIQILPPRPLLNPYPVYTSYGYWLSQ
ncbi:hypothetical protein FPZ12_001300 [Amycolatopsis acidicola]|uniref:Glycosyltransferase RgtA/B/C/D-like domain-containing protein n=1 Tax=Amycolatopsis acidicola TaxID=2596893 RepID=A0A5N0VM63_9PSEU|nr:hypothetical protein [Amycolatopsis acidicola]KAA9166858.1 hypothetical protein FPZ12_001300 [Amycolatopsis acidicola]